MTSVATTSTPTGAPQAESGKLFGLMAEFDSPAAITDAARAACRAGYKWWDCHVPFPVHGLDKAMGVKPTILPICVFFCGLGGLTAGLLLQAFTNASSFDIWAMVWVRGYDFMISGKPMNSLPAWIPVMFELTVLISALSAAGLMLLFNGLPRFYHPTLKNPKFARATDDRFFLVIEARDPKFYRDETEAFMETLKPLSIEVLED